MANVDRAVSKEASGSSSQTAQDANPEYIGQEDFDALLQSNVLDTFVDFDFPYADLNGADADTKPPVEAALSKGWSKVAGRKRTFSQAANWDSVWAKPFSEIGTGLLAGGWESAAVATSLGTPERLIHAAGNIGKHPQDSVKVRGAASGCPGSASHPSADFQAAAATCGPSGLPGHDPDITTDGETGKSCKGRRTIAGGRGGKRQLKPDRMERKASREKRRREEVNERFDQLLRVLEEAEATSGLEPPPPPEGQAASNACINGRRVEVLSRTILVLKKLLKDRMHREVDDGRGSGCDIDRDDEDRTQTSTTAGGGSTILSPSDGAEVPTGSGQLQAEPGNDAAPAATSATPAIHHMAVPVHGHQSVPVPPGFVSMPPGNVPGAGVVNSGLHGQPFFIAVPMYMPPGQSIPSADTSGHATAAAVPSQAASTAPPAVITPAVRDKSDEGVTKAVPPGMGFHPMMTLQMPQFVTQALSTEEGDEKPTHAMCA